MLKTPPAPPPHVKTLDEQKTDFTSEGAPPPGKVGNDVPATAAPVMGADDIKRNSTRRHPLLTRSNIGTLQHAAEPVTPASAVTTSAEPGAVPSVPMQQAFADVKRGLTDTDRAAEAGRTYRKLKG